MDMKAKDDYEVTLLNRFSMRDKEVCFNISDQVLCKVGKRTSFSTFVAKHMYVAWKTVNKWMTIYE